MHSTKSTPSKGVSTKKDKKKKSKRTLLDSLRPEKAPKVRKELLDADYLNKLSPDELEWYAKFMSEWAGASIQKSKKTNAPLTRHLHRSNAKAKELFDANNRRNNDVYGVSKANNLLSDIQTQEDGWYINNNQLVEDAMIAGIDERRLLKKVRKIVKSET